CAAGRRAAAHRRCQPDRRLWRRNRAKLFRARLPKAIGEKLSLGARENVTSNGIEYHRAGRAILTDNDDGSGGAADQERDQEPAGGEPRGPVTIAYIAQSAGVSVPTVSKVLNGKSGVSAQKRALIEELINRHGY